MFHHGTPQRKRKSTKAHSTSSLHSTQEASIKASSLDLSAAETSSVTKDYYYLNRDNPEKIKLSWSATENLGYGFYCGQSAVWGNTVYFKNGGSNDLFEYSTRNNSWTRLVSCPMKGYALVVIDGLVTAIGGYTVLRNDDNRLLSLIDGHWLEQYPPMPTGRVYTMATTSNTTLVVAGGSVRNNVRISTVEIMDTVTKVWSRVPDLPKPLSSGSMLATGDELFVIGGFDSNGKPSTGVVKCYISDLLSTSKEIFYNEEQQTMSVLPTDEPWQRITKGQAMTEDLWLKLPNVPLLYTSCAIIHACVVAVGGMKSLGEGKRPSGDIYRFNPSSDVWEVIGTLPTPRYMCVTASLANVRELMVVGGLNGQIGGDYLNLLEVASCST